MGRSSDLTWTAPTTELDAAAILAVIDEAYPVIIFSQVQPLVTHTSNLAKSQKYWHGVGFDISVPRRATASGIYLEDKV